MFFQFSAEASGANEPTVPSPGVCWVKWWQRRSGFSVGSQDLMWKHREQEISRHSHKVPNIIQNPCTKPRIHTLLQLKHFALFVPYVALSVENPGQILSPRQERVQMTVAAFIEMGRDSLSPLGHGAPGRRATITITHDHKRWMRVQKRGSTFLTQVMRVLVYETAISSFLWPCLCAPAHLWICFF